MTRKAALTVRLPGARIAPAKSTWTCGHRRLENSGTNGFSRCSIVVGRVRIITSLWRIGDDRTLPFFLTEWIKSSVEKLSEKGSEGDSEGGSGQHKAGQTGRKRSSRRSMGLRHGRLWDFSDSLRRGS